MITHINNFLVLITQFTSSENHKMVAKIDRDDAETAIDCACLETDDGKVFSPLGIWFGVEYELHLPDNEQQSALLYIDSKTIKDGIKDGEEVAIVLYEEPNIEIIGDAREINILTDEDSTDDEDLSNVRILYGVKYRR